MAAWRDSSSPAGSAAAPPAGRVLVTGITGSIGAALARRLAADGLAVRGLTRDPRRLAGAGGIEIVTGDAVTGAGLDTACDGVGLAYFLIHALEPAADGAAAPFAAREREAARRFARAARRAGVRRVVYLGGLVPSAAPPSPHLASRLAVEGLLLDEAPGATALRASIVISARSRSFRFLVRLVERLPVLALPPWRSRRTQPIDGRDVLELLVRAGRDPALAGRSLDIAGPDVLRYDEMIERIADLMLVRRPRIELPRLAASAPAQRVAAAIGSEVPELIAPLMAGLEHDLLPREGGDDAAALLGVRMHRFDAAVERALRDWEAVEPLAAR